MTRLRLVGTTVASFVAAGALAGCDRLLGAGAVAAPTCRRISAEVCQRHARDLGLGRDPTVVAVHLECSVARCTPDNGEVRAFVRRSDGRVERSAVGWNAVEHGPFPEQGHASTPGP